MCIVCVEYSKKKLNANEALRNLLEIKEEVGEDHYEEAADKIYQEYLQEQLEEHLNHTGFGD
tara:strand:- start:164 stop:349 length:186 start_codon:yes stop_codon:yes gene_type:complete